MLGADRVQRTGLNTIPAPHAHILKYHGLFKGAIDLFQYFMGAGWYCGATALLRVTLFGAAFIVIH